MSRRHAALPAMHTCTFRVRVVGGLYAQPDATKIWREIELRADQTLADLGRLIPPTFGFDDDHLWSFFLSVKPWDRASEYARTTEPGLLAAKPKRKADHLRVREAPAGREFLFLFDYGDGWHFGVKLVRTGDVELGARYPRVVASHGQAPPQYPDLDDEDDWDEEAIKEREGLLERFAAWAERQGAADAVEMASALLEYKSQDGDGSLGRWTADDLRDVLLEWCPHYLTVPDEDVPQAIRATRVPRLPRPDRAAGTRQRPNPDVGGDPGLDRPSVRGGHAGYRQARPGQGDASRHAGCGVWTSKTAPR